MSFVMTTLAVYVHDLSPFLIWPIRWYGLSYIAGFVCAWLIIRRVCRVGVTTLKPEHAGDLVFAVGIGAVVGGRLGFVLFYDPALLWKLYDGFPWWGLLAVNHGGMASHGGIIGAAIAGWLYTRKHQQPLRFVWDLMALGTPLGLCFGRLANFINGELWGRPVNDAFPLAVKFPQEMNEWLNLSTPDGAPDPRLTSDAFLQAVQQVGVSSTEWRDAVAGARFDQASRDLVYGTIADLTNLLHSSTQRGSEIAGKLLPLITTRHPSQLYQAALEGLLLFLILLVFYRKPRRPGSVGALFLLGYAAMRIIGEQFREPDEGIGFQWLGLTRGQWLSVAVLAGGVVLALYVWKKGESPMGGWLRGSQSEKGKVKNENDPASSAAV